MIKIIHCIKSGPVEGFGNHELACIESWKRDYPDFEIRFWGDDQVREMMSDCQYACDSYNRGVYVFAMDYVKLKILYEFGGMYLDTDVFSIERISNEYFEKAFLPWQCCLGSCWTNNGTVCYTEPHNPIFLEFIEHYRNTEPLGDSEFNEGNFHDNQWIDVVLRKHGLTVENRVTCSLEDQDLDYIRIVNRVQFGVTDFISGYLTLDDRKPYLMHCLNGSWVDSLSENVAIYYQILSEDTDLDSFSEKLNYFTNLSVDENENAPKVRYLLFINTINGSEKEFVERLLYEIPHKGFRNKDWKSVPIGNGMDYRTAQSCAIDYIAKRFRKVKIVRNLGS